MTNNNNPTVPTPITDKNGKQTTVHKSVVTPTSPNPRVASIPTAPAKVKRAFPEITAVHHSGCVCTSCGTGETVNYDTWLAKAKPLDIIRLIKTPEYDYGDNNDGIQLIANQTGVSKFELLFNYDYEDEGTDQNYFQSVLKEQYTDLLRKYSDVATDYLSGHREFDEALAVDPRACGCTECIIGEYIPEENFYPTAAPADVAALITGDLRNNTGSSDFNIIFQAGYHNREVDNLIEDLHKEFDSLHDSLDIKSAAEQATW